MVNRVVELSTLYSTPPSHPLWGEIKSFLQRQQALGLKGVDLPSSWGVVAKPSPKTFSGKHEQTADSSEVLAWPELRSAIGACTACRLHEGRTGAVLGRGGEQARLMFFGEAPSRDDDLQGEVFVGSPGALLTRMITAMGLNADSVFVGNIVACRPARNRPARSDEIAACRAFLSNQIKLIAPQVIVALGEGATRALFDSSGGIDELRGTWTTFLGIPVVSTYHPQMLLEFPGKKKLCWQDLQAVMARLDEDGPSQRGTNLT